jgi:4,5-DOPA dioxygenase extradiol
VKLPAVFVSHGAPSLALEPHDPSHAFLTRLGRDLGRPAAIVCVSAHWEAPRPTVGAAERPATIHDFYGFPAPLYEIRYPAPGAPALAARVASMLGMPAALDAQRGLDHGAWVPLSLMYPGADVPVVQLSVQSRLDAAHHAALGRALASLREEGVLILGSGGATHDLRRVAWGAGDDDVPADVRAFEGWLVAAVEGGRTDELIAWRERAPSPDSNHPTPEHFFPLFAPLGAAAPGTKGRVLHRAFAYGALSMAAFAWD